MSQQMAASTKGLTPKDRMQMPQTIIDHFEEGVEYGVRDKRWKMWWKDEVSGNRSKYGPLKVQMQIPPIATDINYVTGNGDFQKSEYSTKIEESSFKISVLPYVIPENLQELKKFNKERFLKNQQKCMHGLFIIQENAKRKLLRENDDFMPEFKKDALESTYKTLMRFKKQKEFAAVKFSKASNSVFLKMKELVKMDGELADLARETYYDILESRWIDLIKTNETLEELLDTSKTTFVKDDEVKDRCLYFTNKVYSNASKRSPYSINAIKKGRHPACAKYDFIMPATEKNPTPQDMVYSPVVIHTEVRNRNTGKKTCMRLSYHPDATEQSTDPHMLHPLLYHSIIEHELDIAITHKDGRMDNNATMCGLKGYLGEILRIRKGTVKASKQAFRNRDQEINDELYESDEEKHELEEQAFNPKPVEPQAPGAKADFSAQSSKRHRNQSAEDGEDEENGEQEDGTDEHQSKKTREASDNSAFDASSIASIAEDVYDMEDHDDLADDEI